MGNLHIGVDVGSTTIKTVVMDENFNVLHREYKRHYSDTKNTLCEVLMELSKKYVDSKFTIGLTGSGAMSAAKFLDLPFLQEVVACKKAVEKYIEKTNVVIELGGEDAKIIYFDNNIEQRMNGTCAGGTGAFIDQMALLLNTDSAGLNELAKNYTTIYPIASRCGVFAKTDIQPLINEGVTKEDIAASIFQAVVNQTISGLACGRPITGNVAFLGGPLNYLSELRQRFIETLKLKEEEIFIPEEAHLFVAKGAALETLDEGVIDNAELEIRIENLRNSQEEGTNSLEPLFENDEDYEIFKKRHNSHCVNKVDINEYKGDCFLGIDAGSTTAKLVVIDENGTLLYSAYGSNQGSPLKTSINMVKEFYKILPKNVKIRYCGVTGYGEKLIQTALKIELNEIETIAHYTAASKFVPNVTSIVDIGGQDMKYIKIKDGAIDNIMLNEACSSGCGSFIETFAKSLGLSIQEFIKLAVESKRPVDLGSRCTVFMNSKIKQAQKEGFEVGDISAGLSYSVIKNAIQKVMKIRDTKSLGENVVVQGGTFYNDAVLRAFEKTIGKEVTRLDIAGLMGAYGVALLAQEKFANNKDKEYVSTIIGAEDLNKISIETSNARCNKCENQCLLTVNRFNDGSRYISGNRCERGAGYASKGTELPNIVKYKYSRIFQYEPLEEKKAKRGVIGIPRVLNMYEDYPFWFTFLTELGFRVIISDKSTRKLYESGMESMPSESVCFPAKLSHGHIMNLIKKGIKTIFYPCIPYSRKENEDADNNYNCPIVISYPEALRNNVEDLKNIKFLNPFLPLGPKQIAKTIMDLPEFKEYDFSYTELFLAAMKAENEAKKAKQDIQKKGQETLDFIEKNNLRGIVLAGRPYHVDPEVNHGIDTLITSLGLCVLTEDSISHLVKPKRPLRVVDQWTYHSRLYAAAEYVGRNDKLEIVQLNSFGCGVDAVTIDQVQEILESFGKMYTTIKIDEINNLGAIKIRIRSLIASMNKRQQEKSMKTGYGDYINKKKIFTKSMREKYTILMPQMAPIHFDLLSEALKSSGYKLELLKNCTNKTVETGLKYVNNDACYPSIIVIGQLIEALESGKYDLDKTALIISQTGGGCRATNYIGFIRKALKDAGLEKVPVISFNVSGMEKMPGFKLTLPIAKKLIKGCIYADILQKMLNKNIVYEVNKGETQKLFDEWMERCIKLVRKSNVWQFNRSIRKIVEDFEKIELDTSVEKPKVGIVGEILIKYHPFGNNFIVDKLQKEGAEVILPDFMGFVKYVASGQVIWNKLLKTSRLKARTYKAVIKLIDRIEKDERVALSKSKKGYLPPSNIWELEDHIKGVLSAGNQTGEGWFLTAEMIEYIENGIPNIVCVQPFACLPNHVVGKGVIKTIRSKFPEANISPIDYDPGASESNQMNRIKLLMTVAKENLANNKKRLKRIEKENILESDNKEKITQ